MNVLETKKVLYNLKDNPQELKEAWRLVLHNFHPDNGGNHKDFLELKSYYDNLPNKTLPPELESEDDGSLDVYKAEQYGFNMSTPKNGPKTIVGDLFTERQDIKKNLISFSDSAKYIKAKAVINKVDDSVNIYIYKIKLPVNTNAFNLPIDRVSMMKKLTSAKFPKEFVEELSDLYLLIYRHSTKVLDPSSNTVTSLSPRTNITIGKPNGAPPTTDGGVIQSFNDKYRDYFDRYVKGEISLSRIPIEYLSVSYINPARKRDELKRLDRWFKTFTTYMDWVQSIETYPEIVVEKIFNIPEVEDLDKALDLALSKSPSVYYMEDFKKKYPKKKFNTDKDNTIAALTTMLLDDSTMIYDKDLLILIEKYPDILKITKADLLSHIRKVKDKLARTGLLLNYIYSVCNNTHFDMYTRIIDNQLLSIMKDVGGVQFPVSSVYFGVLLHPRVALSNLQDLDRSISDTGLNLMKIGYSKCMGFDQAANLSKKFIKNKNVDLSKLPNLSKIVD